MKAQKLLLISTLIASGAVFAFSQDAGSPDYDSEEAAESVSRNVATEEEEEEGLPPFLAEADALAASVKNAGTSAEKFIAKKGWNPGLNDDGRYVAIGRAKIASGPTNSKHQADRQIAFKEALLDAKSQIVQYYMQTISSTMKKSLSSGTRPSAAKSPVANPTVLNRLEALAKKKIEEELGNEPAGEEVVEEVVGSKSFQSLIQSVAKQQVGALVTSKIFEQEGELAVVVYYSDKMKALAAALNGSNGNDLPKGPPRKGGTVNSWVHSLKISQLYPSMGIQPTTDNKGNLVILSYAQSSTSRNDPIALEAAYDDLKLEADGAIRQFAGEVVAVSVRNQKLQNQKTLSDGTFQSVTDTQLDKEVEAIAGGLNISGIVPLRKWNFKDPRSGTTVFGIVCMWSAKSADLANRERESMKQATKNRGGRVKPKAKAKDAGARNRETNYSVTEKDIQYKIESIEAEDF